MMLAEFGIFQTGYWNSRISALGFIALSLVLSAAMGYVSWHGLEKHVLRLKKRWPGRTTQSVL
jgi:peptidoglycan/LPS O-acetylase OafA/YrhL